jgi:hypothetical protein
MTLMIPHSVDRRMLRASLVLPEFTVEKRAERLRAIFATKVEMPSRVFAQKRDREHHRPCSLDMEVRRRCAS